MKPIALMMVTVQVRDFDSAVAWYRDVLGLTVLWIEQGEFCSLAVRGSQGPAIALATDHPDRIPSTPGLGWTPILTVDDFDATVAELRSHEVVIDTEEEGSDEGYRLIRVRDPEGNPIGITTFS